MNHEGKIPVKLKCERFGVGRKMYGMLASKNMVDVTLLCQGQSMQVHKIVLAACSSHFRATFKNNPAEHPVLTMDNMNMSELKDLVDYMYIGEVSLNNENFERFLQLAEELKISGLPTQQQDENSDAPVDPNDPAKYCSMSIGGNCEFAENDFCLDSDSD